MKHGTEWTEPGQGATIHEFFGAVADPTDAVLLIDPTPAIRHLDRIAYDGFRYDYSYKTNLRLTGEPITPEDLKRIAKCK